MMYIFPINASILIEESIIFRPLFATHLLGWTFQLFGRRRPKAGSSTWRTGEGSALGDITEGQWGRGAANRKWCEGTETQLEGWCCCLQFL